MQQLTKVSISCVVFYLSCSNMYLQLDMYIHQSADPGIQWDVRREWFSFYYLPDECSINHNGTKIDAAQCVFHISIY